MGASRRDEGRPGYCGTRAEAARRASLSHGRTGWFTEGFEMPDLREAKTLLDELASVAPGSLGVLQRSAGS